MGAVGVIVTTIVSTIGTTGLLLVLAWLCREWITTRLRATVKFDFDTRLEAVKHENAEAIQRLTTELRQGETTLNAMRAEVFDAASHRRKAVDARKLDAIDLLWTTLSLDLRKFTAPAMMLTWINYREAAKSAAEHPALATMFRTLLPTKWDMDSDPRGKASVGQPYVSSSAWALFAAYSAIVTFGYLQVKFLADGIDKPEFFNYSAVEKVVVTALPHRADEVREQGPSCYGNLLTELETSLLAEIQTFIEGHDVATAAMVQTNAIIAASNAATVDESAATRAAVVAEMTALLPQAGMAAMQEHDAL